MIVIPNQNLFRIANEKTTFAEAFVLADQVLYSGIACIVDLIVKEGLINLDFADVRTVMSGMGAAMMGTGEAAGEHRAVTAAEEAISNPLLDDISLRGAKGLLLSITGGRNLTLYEVDEAATRVRQEVDPEANIIVGATFDDTLGDRIRVSIVASGMDRIGDSQSAQPSARPTHNAAPQPQAPTWPQAHGEPHLARQNVPLQPAQAPANTSQVPPAMAADHHAGAPREPGPLAVGNGRQQDDLARALAQAFGPPSSSGEQAPRQQWASPSGALFEEAAPQIAGSATVVPALPPHLELQSARDESFTAQAPIEVRRGPRRLPEVDDFPPIGQREYRAKAEHYADPYAPPPARAPSAEGAAGGLSNAHGAATPPRALGRPPTEPPRKLGFLERLTGAKRRNREPEPVAPPTHYPQAGKAVSREAPASHHAAGKRGAGDPAVRSTHDDEGFEPTDFSGRGRRSR